MNIHQLEYFVASIHEGSFALAAKSLYVSPQAVSKAIRSLENESRLRLCVRAGNRLVLTSWGEVVYRQAVDLLKGFDELCALLRDPASANNSPAISCCSQGVQGAEQTVRRRERRFCPAFLASEHHIVPPAGIADDPRSTKEPKRCLPCRLLSKSPASDIPALVIDAKG
ncbi:MAG: LysR family transcriptional regulator [Coriobacteriaceae bacterium]|nr:LysR family transcriptional regulator [Coriobacteriaceae bacterium]